MIISTKHFVFLGVVAVVAPFGACSGYTNLGDPPVDGAGGDAGSGNETGGTGGPSTGSGGSSAETGNGGSATGGGGRSAGTGGESTSGGGAAGTGGSSTGGETSGGAGPGNGGSAGSGAPGGSGPEPDGGMSDASAGSTSMPPGDGGGDTGCELDACNDHGACIEREGWSLCDCAVDRLPTCELPLFREIGPSRTSEELILVSLSGDGTTIVGYHRPSGSPDPRYGIKWTLDEGIVALSQDPAGPTVAISANLDASLIRGHVETPEHTILREVVWRNGVLGAPSDDDDPPTPGPRLPTVTELEQMLVDLGIDARAWDIWVVNDISDDGKVIFGLGLIPGRGARWLLRLP